MTLGAIVTVGSLVWLKSQSEMHTLRHQEVMSEIENLKSGIAPAAPVARDLLAAVTPDNRAVLQLLSADDKSRKAGLAYLESHWSSHDPAKVLEVLPFLSASSGEREPVVMLLQRKTGQSFGSDLPAWKKWLLGRTPSEKKYTDKNENLSYLDFKSLLYHLCDPRFIHYFAHAPKITIDAEEVNWLGVLQTPALRHAAFVPAAAATYLKNSDLVFGITSAQNSVAFPQRILVWHNLVETNWQPGGQTTNLLIVYEPSRHLARIFERAVDDKGGFSQSGFGYHDEQLFVQDSAKSLWSPKLGQAVISSAKVGFKLKALPVVATSWGAWKAEHPQTAVLSSNTGFDRNYAAGEP